MAATYTFDASKYKYNGIKEFIEATDANWGTLWLGDQYITINFESCQAQSTSGSDRLGSIKVEQGKTVTVSGSYTITGIDVTYNTNDGQTHTENYTYYYGTSQAFTANDAQWLITKIVVTYTRWTSQSTGVPNVSYKCIQDGGTEYNPNASELYTGEMLRVYMAPNGYDPLTGYDTWSTGTEYEIYYTTDGRDPNSKTDDYGQPTATKYTGGAVSFTTSSTISMRVWDKRRLLWGNASSRTYNFDFGFSKPAAKNADETLDAGQKDAYQDNGRTYLTVTYGSPGDNYYDSQGKAKGLWANSKEESEADMNNSQIGEFKCYFPGNKDAEGENKWDYEEQKYNPNRYKYDGEADQGKLNTFDIPIAGAYFKFEPEVDGQINVIVRQTGIMSTESGKDVTDELKKVVKRYAFVCDETGEPIDDLTAMISDNSIVENRAFAFTADTGTGDGYLIDFEKNGDYFERTVSVDKLYDYMVEFYKYQYDLGEDKSYNDFKDYRIYNDGERYSDTGDYDPELKTIAKDYWDFCKDKYVTVGKEKDKDGKDIFGATATGTKCFLKNLLVKDKYGYYTLGKAYVRYSFPAKAGKTYFMMGRWTKLGPCGFSFKRDIKDDTAWDDIIGNGFDTSSGHYYGRNITIDGTKTEDVSLPEPFAPQAWEYSKSDGTRVVGTIYSSRINFKRAFRANVWTSLVLPFSMSPKMVEDVFGEKTKIVHFNRVDEHYKDEDGMKKGTNTLHLTQHWHQMIVAGTPVFIKPTKEISANGFTVDNGSYDPTTPIWDMDGNPDNDWCITGSYTPAEVPVGAYIMGYNPTTTENNLRRITIEGTKVAGTRAWIINKENPTSQLASIYLNGIEDESTTAIGEILLGEEPATVKGAYATGIYNLNGQLVRSNTTDTAGLPAGIYIAGGKKVVVK